MRWIIKKLADAFYRIWIWLRDVLGRLQGPQITGFSSATEYSGAIIDITGYNFGALREDNEVTIGGVVARVIEASATKLKVLTDISTRTGKINVKVGTRDFTTTHDFVVKSYPAPGSGDDGPPIVYAGSGFPESGDVPPTGTMKILVCLVHPSDRAPANAANSRADVQASWDNVHTFYNQASYGTLNVEVDMMANYSPLSGNRATYIDAAISNIRPEILPRIMAEAAQAAVDEGFDLDDYQMIACVVHLQGEFIRAWGGSSASSWRFDDEDIDLSTTNPLNQLWIQDDANWGRYTHETGHNIVSKPSGIDAQNDFAERTLGEDIYDSDLVDGNAASAQLFDMMGSHDNHPLYSAYHMEKTGWYDAANIRVLQWDRNANSFDVDVIAHGTARDTMANRFHLVKIKVGDGLFYYVEVRQRPAAGDHIFDDSIPVGARDGGVVITKVITDTVNNNQQMRFISLLHDEGMERTLQTGESANDPARALTITVIDDNIQSRPRVCRVRIAWAQAIADVPGGSFDLRIDPWDSNWQTPDIWIDRSPFGTFDKPNDAQGRPQGNGDKPRPQEINRFNCRVHNDGADAANNVKVTFYSVEPPGVGDNGNWTPLSTETISNIGNNSFQDIFTQWVPVIGRHTCMKVFVQQQLGEVTGGNNFAQENVFDFVAPAGSVPMPVYIPLAVRNPHDYPIIAHISFNGVKAGYIAQFPHQWVHLAPRAERQLELTVICTLDYPAYEQLPKKFKRETKDFSSHIRVTGYYPRSYSKEIGTTGVPGSKLERIGGIFANVTPKKKVTLHIGQDDRQNKKMQACIVGSIKPGSGHEAIRVDFESPLFGKITVMTTANAGSFGTCLDLMPIFKELVDKKKVKDEADFLSNLNLTAVAISWNAANITDAESNKLYMNL